MHVCLSPRMHASTHTLSIYNNQIVNLAMGVAYVDGRTNGRGSGSKHGRRRWAHTDDVHTGCGRGWRERGQHGACLIL